jgi:hypothetical protein
VLTRAYRLEGRVIALIDSQGEMQAALPMVRSKLPWRQRWTSLPFTDTLEPVASTNAYRDELLLALAQEAATQPIIVRAHAPLRGWFSRQVGTVQVLDLSSGAAGVLRAASRGHRRSVQRAQRASSGLSVKQIASREEFLGPNLALIAQSRTRLGAPTQPRRYWAQVWELHERDEAVTFGVYLRSRLVANGIFMLGTNHAVLKYSASDPTTWDLRTNHLMFASALEELCAYGLQSLDFGITDIRNKTLRDYKSRWGGEERPAHYSATDPRLLPDTLEPGRVLSGAIQRSPVLVGRTMGALAYRFVA